MPLEGEEYAAEADGTQTDVALSEAAWPINSAAPIGANNAPTATS